MSEGRGGSPLAGQVAIVTGAGRGLGRTYARHLAQLGASVVVNDLDEGAVGAVVEEIQAEGGRAEPSCHSVGTPSGGSAVVADAIEAFGTVDVVINNAGILRNGYFEELTVEEVQSVVEVDLEAAFYVTQPAWKIMLEKGYGRVVLASSGAGMYGRQGGANYCAAKAGLFGLGRALAHEGADYGIRTNIVLPIASTEGTREYKRPPLRDGQPRRAEGVVASTGRGDPDWVAPLVGYLASPDCAVNGTAFSASFGCYAQVFVGITEGWTSPAGSPPTWADLADHIDDICQPSRHFVPISVDDEVAAGASRVAEHLNA